MHMVGCKPEFRGLGIGGILSELTEYVFKKEGMQTATLKTDDWRIPAIKTYLKIGYKPDLVSEPDYKERWDKIYQIINEFNLYSLNAIFNNSFNAYLYSVQKNL